MNKLRCSDCGSGYETRFSSPLASIGGSVEYGVVGCKCGEFPVVDGILVTRKYKNLQKTVEKIRSARTKLQLWQTALLLIDETYVRFIIRLSFYVRALFGKWPWLSFWKVVTFIKNSRYSTYLKYRFSCPSFIASTAFIPAIRQAAGSEGLILDLGSGVAHYDFELSGHVDPGQIICADKGFMNLFLAKNYIVGEKASFICLDADNRIPFGDRIFSVVISMDAFHYIDKKAQLASEFIRSLKEGGLLLLLHLHNRLVENMAKGLPASPSEYAGFFPGFENRMYAEKFLVSSVLGLKGLNMAEGQATGEVEASDAVAIALSRDKGLFRKYESHMKYEGKAYRKQMLSPIYMRAGKDYELRFPSDFYEEEYYLIKEFFPKRISADTPVSELADKLIMINVPENFMKKNERIHRFKLWR